MACHRGTGMQNRMRLGAESLWRQRHTVIFSRVWCSAVMIVILLWSTVTMAADPSTTPPGIIVPKGVISEADRLGLPPTPAYVTAWPRQVSVEKPDPVLGDKPFYEIWAYSKEFARRFKNFPLEGADDDFSAGAHAFVFRVYKDVIFKSLNYPEQYVCEYDFYFDSSIRIPMSERQSKAYKYKYPPGVTVSYLRLDPINESDRQSLRVAKHVPFVVQQWPAIFADGSLDGRFATFGVAYYPEIVPGLAMVRLRAMFNCAAMAPKQDTVHFWLSLLGDRPYKMGPLSKAFLGSHIRGMQGSFDPGAEPMKDGYFRIPEAFYRAVLPKVTLAKALNDCIGLRHTSAALNKGSQEAWEKVYAACQEMEESGTIYNVLGGRVVEGLSELGF